MLRSAASVESAVAKADDEPRPEILSISPPRRKWKRPPRLRRKNLDGAAVIAKSIEAVYWKQSNSSSHAQPDWYANFLQFAEAVRDTALSATGQIESPEVFPSLKSRSDGISKYRVVATYPLMSKVVSALLTRYLRAQLDPVFLPCSFAFRAPGFGPRGEASHTSAAKKLLDFEAAVPEESDIWIAECDIRGFFDTIHHDVVRDSMDRVVEEASASGNDVDRRALDLVERFLVTYSFPEVGFCECAQRLKGGPRWDIPWPEDALRAWYSEPWRERIGLPQGAAHSCVLANVVMHRSDRSVGPMAAEGGVYLRYCDDMIIANLDRERCIESFRAYQDELAKLRLPIHEPRCVPADRKEFWKLKSRSPYRWSNRTSSANVGSPWIGFLGYELGRGQKVRVRRSSLIKQIDRIREEVDAAIRIVRTACEAVRAGRSSGLGYSRASFFAQVKARVIARGVGTNPAPIRSTKDAGFSWAAGFSLLAEGELDGRQLSQLDRARNRQLRRLSRAIRECPEAFGRNKKGSERRAHRSRSDYLMTYHGRFRSEAE